MVETKLGIVFVEYTDEMQSTPRFQDNPTESNVDHICIEIDKLGFTFSVHMGEGWNAFSTRILPIELDVISLLHSHLFIVVLPLGKRIK